MAGRSSKAKSTPKNAKADAPEHGDVGLLTEIVKSQNTQIMLLEQAVTALEQQLPDGYYPKLADRKILYAEQGIDAAGNNSVEALAYRETEKAAAERVRGAAERAEAVERERKGVGNDEDADDDAENPEGNPGSEEGAGTGEGAGSEGPQGPTASLGDKAPEGASGPTGPTGSTGPTGAPGSSNRSR